MNENKQEEKSDLIINEPKNSSINSSDIEHYDENKARIRNSITSKTSFTFLSDSEDLEKAIDLKNKDNVNSGDSFDINLIKK